MTLVGHSLMRVFRNIFYVRLLHSQRLQMVIGGGLWWDKDGGNGREWTHCDR